MNLRPDNNSGFTLLELVVAVAIFSILASIAYGGLSVVLTNNEQHERVTRQLSDLQTTYLFIQRDIEQAVNRTVRVDGIENQPAMYALPNDKLLLILTRAGWLNPLETKRSELQRVSYRIEDGKLFRGYWVELDRTQNTLQHETVLFTDFSAIHIRFLDINNQWHPSWPPVKGNNQDNNLPVAIEITIDSNEFGPITRLFSLKNV